MAKKTKEEPLDERQSVSRQKFDEIYESRHHDTDLANARRLLKIKADDLRYLSDAADWIAWDSTKWGPGRDLASSWVSKKVSKYIEDIELPMAANDTHYEILSKCAKRLQMSHGIENCLEVASTLEEFSLKGKDLDANPWMINLQNGRFDLKAQKFSLHTRQDYCTKLANVVYNEKAEAPIFSNLVDFVFNNDREVIDYFQEVAGYALTGLNTAQNFWFLAGPPGTGKSTVIEGLYHIMGDYATTLRAESLMLRQFGSDRVPADIAKLRGVRFVLTAEVSRDFKWNENLLCDLTSGNAISARFMRQNEFTFTPICKVFTQGNSKPEGRNSDSGIWRRLRLLLCEQKIETIDQKFFEKIQAEAPGIFNWAVEGLKRFIDRGCSFNEPQIILDAVEEYREASDPLGQWVKAECLVSPMVSAPLVDLYESYEKWCEDDAGLKAMSKFTFGKRLNEFGFKSGKSRKLGRIRHGITIKTEVGSEEIEV